MTDEAPHEPEPEVHHHKPPHVMEKAEKLEGWVVWAMGIVGAVLLVVLIWAFMQTGSGVPSWMK